MALFVEIHNGECGLGGHFCDQQRDHGPSVTAAMSSHLNLFPHGRTQNPEPRSHEQEFNKESALS